MSKNELVGLSIVIDLVIDLNEESFNIKVIVLPTLLFLIASRLTSLALISNILDISS